MVFLQKVLGSGLPISINPAAWEMGGLMLNFNYAGGQLKVRLDSIKDNIYGSNNKNNSI
jgi:hypothetical protein